jgi:hypothetical protein
MLQAGRTSWRTYANCVTEYACMSVPAYCLGEIIKGRGDYGKENPARTDGMPSCQTPALETKVDVTRLMMPRDHPRLQQTSHELLLAWRANIDFRDRRDSKRHSR